MANEISIAIPPENAVEVAVDQGSVIVDAQLASGAVEIAIEDEDFLVDTPQVPGEVAIDVVVIEGPRGPAGANVIELTAATAIGGHRVVIAGDDGVEIASSDNPAHAGRVVGVTTGAAEQGATAFVQQTGELVELSWNWTLSPIYLGTNGVLTQTAPAVGFSQQIGVATAPTKILINVGPAILLG